MTKDVALQKRMDAAHERARVVMLMLLYFGPLAIVFGLPEIFDRNDWTILVFGGGLAFGSIALSYWLPDVCGEWAAKQVQRRYDRAAHR